MRALGPGVSRLRPLLLKVKFMFANADHGVGFLAAGNLLLSGVEKFCGQLEIVLHSLLSLGQVAVAIATVFYIYRKAKAIRVRKSRRGKE